MPPTATKFVAALGATLLRTICRIPKFLRAKIPKVRNRVAFLCIPHETPEVFQSDARKTTCNKGTPRGLSDTP